MLKKFKKWRENLTWKQVEKIMIIVGIVLVILCVISVISNGKMGAEGIPVCILILISFVCIFFIEVFIYLVLDGDSKQYDFDDNFQFEEDDEEK